MKNPVERPMQNYQTIRAITRTVTDVFHHIDARRWSDLLRLFANQLTTDYTSLFGGEAQTASAADLVGGWEPLLELFDATQHLLGPISVDGDDAQARAECHVRAYHTKAGAPGGDRWMFAGHYIFELQRTDSQWLIASMTLQVFYQDGNLNLLEVADAAG